MKFNSCQWRWLMNDHYGYQDSGFEWIREIPNDWTLSRVGKYFTERSEKVDDVNYPPLSVTMSGIVDQLSDVAKTSDGENRKLVKKYDFVINSRSDRKGSSGIAPRDGSVSLINIVLEPHDIDPQFIQNLFKSYYFKEEFFRNGKGIHWDLWTTRWDQFKNINIPIPPQKEQKLISRYLDKKIKNIDSLIGKIQQRKDLIKESIRTYWFEVRLKNIKLNQYPNEWFQLLPDGWEIIKFRQLFEPIKITNNSPAERLLSVTQDKGVVFRDEQDRDVVNPGDDISSYKLVEPGDVIISLRSADGGLEISDVRGLVSPAYIVLRPKKEIDRNFYRFLLTSKNFIIEMNRYIKGIRDGKNIYFDDIKDVLIPYLPFSKWDKNQYDLINIHQNLVNSFVLHDRKIKLLEEYRQSLISSVVTGKVRITKDMV